MIDRAKGTISVLVLDDSGRYGEPAAAALGTEPNFMLVTSRLGHGEGVQAAKSQRPDVILVGGKVPELTSVIEELDDAVPDSAIIVILEPGEEDLARQCTLAGARGYLFKFPQKEELITSVRELTRRQARRRAQLAATIMPGVRLDQAKLIAVHGAKGGVGTTTVAANLAVAMRKQSRRTIALVDANLHGGDIGVILNLLSPYSIADLVPHLKNLDAELIQGIMVGHHSGVRTLLAPPQLERAESVTAEEMHRILTVVRELADYVVVDTAPNLDQVTLTVLDMADQIVTLTTPELPSLKNAARFLQVCQQSGYPQGKVVLVVNRLKSRGAVSLADIRQSIHHPVTLGLPSEGQRLVEAMNRGEPVVILKRRSGFSKRVYNLSQVLSGNGTGPKPVKAPSRGPLKRLFSRPELEAAEAE